MLTPTIHDCGYNRGNRLALYEYTLPDVGESASGAEQILGNFPLTGIITHIKVSCASLDFDLALFNKTGGVADTVDEIFRTETESKSYDENELDLEYRNADTTLTSALYAKVKNDDGVNHTGSITLEIYVEIMETV